MATLFRDEATLYFCLSQSEFLPWLHVGHFIDQSQCAVFHNLLTWQCLQSCATAPQNMSQKMSNYVREAKRILTWHPSKKINITCPRYWVLLFDPLHGTKWATVASVVDCSCCGYSSVCVYQGSAVWGRPKCVQHDEVFVREKNQCYHGYQCCSQLSWDCLTCLKTNTNGDSVLCWIKHTV